jgi:hypothetical protein
MSYKGFSQAPGETEDEMLPELELPGLERSSSTPLEAGTLIAGLPLDPMLAAVYTRLGYAAFATDVAGLVLSRSNDEERELEEENERWLKNYREQLV